jgi:hypothetical protein
MTSEINKEITRITVSSVEHSNHFFSITQQHVSMVETAVTRVKQRRSEDNQSPPSSAQVTKAPQSPIGFNHAHRAKFAFTTFLMLAKEVASLIPNKRFFTELIKYT